MRLLSVLRHPGQLNMVAGMMFRLHIRTMGQIGQIQYMALVILGCRDLRTAFAIARLLVQLLQSGCIC